MKRLIPLAVVALMVGAVAILAPAGGAQPKSGAVQTAPLQRIVRTFRQRWSYSCNGDSCGISSIPTVLVTTPASAPSVETTVSVTFDYRISRSDGANAGLFYRPKDAPLGSALPMQPGDFGLASTHGFIGSTTLTWAKHALEAGGKQYEFGMGVVGLNLDRDRRVDVSGRRMTFVIEMWMPGP